MIIQISRKIFVQGVRKTLREIFYFARRLATKIIYNPPKSELKKKKKRLVFKAESHKSFNSNHARVQKGGSTLHFSLTRIVSYTICDILTI